MILNHYASGTYGYHCYHGYYFRFLGDVLVNVVWIQQKMSTPGSAAYMFIF